MVRYMACSLCEIERISVADCPHNLRCLTDIAPSDAFEEIRRLIGRPRESAPAPPVQDHALSAL
jgi:hypothetical protein